jgi:IPT/TIG domain/Chitobiase/beta-hexosaminidase C-terminal domain
MISQFRTTVRGLLIPVSLLLIATAMMHGCSGGSSGGGGGQTPSITSLSPTSGAVGTAVTITGTNFGSSQGTSSVTFSGTAGTPTSWSATSIVVPVPKGATSGSVVVTVGGVASNGVSFTISTPNISGLSPTSGPVGTSVNISGTNFGSSQGTSTVTFNGTAGTPTSWSATSIAVPVPSGATTGNVVVTVAGVASNGVSFTVSAPAPNIASLNPTSGPVGDSVTITGTNFGATQGSSTVSFNGTAGTPTSWGATSIVVSVPSGATTGNVVVTVGGVASNGVSFTVAPSPTITSLSPNSAPVGASITIAGANFGATQGSSTVTFAGTLAAPTSWSATSIVVPVPSAATTGNVVVTVDGGASNGVAFTVTPPPAITSISPTSGPITTVVTITGTNFGASQGTSTVTFNGTAATPTSWSATSVVVPVPSGATTGSVIVSVAGVASNGVNFTVMPGTFALVQHPQTNSCSTTAATCSITVAPTGANNLGVVMITLLSATNTWVTSVTDNEGGTWTVPGSNGSGGCYQYAGTFGTNGCAYNLSLPAGVTTITANWSSVVPEGARMDFREYSFSGGAVALDSFGVANGTSSPANTSPNTITGVTPTLTGTNDVIVQAFASGSSAATAVTVYGDANIGYSYFGSADLLNTASKTPPTFSMCCALTDVYGAVYIAFMPAPAGTPQAATPACAPATGTYSTAQSVTCSNPSSAAILCYTTDGTLPATNGAKGCSRGNVVSGPISITTTGTNLQVVAGGEGVRNSAAASNTYTLRVEAPTVSSTAGSSSSPRGVAIATATSGASIRYCLDEANNCTPATAYSAPVAVGTRGFLRAQATLAGFENSSITSAQFQAEQAAVSVTPLRGGATVGQQVQLNAALEDGLNAAGVVWSVSGGGTLTEQTATSASFSAATAGVYTVTATSAADSSKIATATVSVTDLSGVYTYHNDLARDGANTQEYALTTSSVNTATFGKLFSCPVDGAVDAQPLWAANLTVNGAKHNVIFVATEHDSVYAFDADASPCEQLWHASLIDASHGGTASNGTPLETSVPVGPGGNVVASENVLLKPEAGVTGTPVIDPSTNTLYVAAQSVNPYDLTAYQRLHAIDLFTGDEKFGGPANITAPTVTYPGTGDGGATVQFNPAQESQRPGLVLANGTVYVAWASHEGNQAYGWVVGYDAKTLAKTNVFNVSPNVTSGGIWMSGAAPAVDSNNNIYLITGNGVFDAESSTSPNNDYGNSFLRLSSNLSLSKYFTFSNATTGQANAADSWSGGAAILFDLPADGSKPTHFIVGGGKNGVLYLFDRDKMGGSSEANSLERLSVADDVSSTGAFWNNNLYVGGVQSALSAYALSPSTAQFSSSTSQSPEKFGYPGITPSISATGSGNGIVWALDSSADCISGGVCGPAVLHAYDATNLASELWNSSIAAGDTGGNAIKFAVPTIANGKVYVGTRGNNTGGVYGSTSISGELDVYGLKPN